MTNSCKYCLSENGTMISPCKCDGTLKYTHKECIEKWISIKNNSTCEICKTNYKTRTIAKIDFHNLCIDFTLYILPYFCGIFGVFTQVLGKDIERLAICQLISKHLPDDDIFQIIVSINTIFGASLLFYFSLGILRFQKECIIIPKKVPEFYISPETSTSCLIIVNISFAVGTIFWLLIFCAGYKSSLRKNTRTIREIV